MSFFFDELRMEIIIIHASLPSSEMGDRQQGVRDSKAVMK
jgi:hypothetical protein